MTITKFPELSRQENGEDDVSILDEERQGVETTKERLRFVVFLILKERGKEIGVKRTKECLSRSNSKGGRRKCTKGQDNQRPGYRL